MINDDKQSVLTDEEIDARRVPTGKFAEWESGSYQYRRAFARAIEQTVLSKLRGAGEPVAIIADGWNVLFIGSGPIAPIVEKHGLKIGSLLYAAPQVDADVRNAALEEAAKVCDDRFIDDPEFSSDNTTAEIIAQDIRALKSAPAAEPETLGEVLADHRRLVRELDVLLNGEEGAAKQASLCDIVAQVRREGIRAPAAEPGRRRRMMAASRYEGWDY